MALHCIGVLVVSNNGEKIYNVDGMVPFGVDNLTVIGIRVYNDRTGIIMDMSNADVVKKHRGIRNLPDDRVHILYGSGYVDWTNKFETVIQCRVNNGVVTKEEITNNFTIIWKTDDRSYRVCAKAGLLVEDTNTEKLIYSGYNNCTNGVYKQDGYSPDSGIKPCGRTRNFLCKIDFEEVAKIIIGRYKKEMVMHGGRKVSEMFLDVFKKMNIHGGRIWNRHIASIIINDYEIWKIACGDIYWQDLCKDKVTKWYIGCDMVDISPDSVSSAEIGINIEELILSDRVKKVNSYVFSKAVFLEKLKVYGDNIEFGLYAFEKCKRLSYVEVIGNDNTYRNLLRALQFCCNVDNIKVVRK